MAGMKEVHIVISLAMDPNDPAVLYGGTTGGMYRSEDGAMTWKKINNGLIPESELMASMALGVNAIEIDHMNPDIVYAGTTKGLYRTTNKGESWARIGQSIPNRLSAVSCSTPATRRFSTSEGPAESGRVTTAEKHGRPELTAWPV